MALIQILCLAWKAYYLLICCACLCLSSPSASNAFCHETMQMHQKQLFGVLLCTQLQVFCCFWLVTSVAACDGCACQFEIDQRVPAAPLWNNRFLWWKSKHFCVQLSRKKDDEYKRNFSSKNPLKLPNDFETWKSWLLPHKRLSDVWYNLNFSCCLINKNLFLLLLVTKMSVDELHQLNTQLLMQIQSKWT